MKLFFDTETTGLVNWKLPDTHESQPRLIQLGCILTEDDGTVRRTLGLIVDQGIDIPIEASNVHGITREIAKKYGVPFSFTLVDLVGRIFHEADEIIAHNYKFDKVVMNRFFHEGNMKPIDDSKSFCTMEACTDICCIPFVNRRAYGNQKYKWPKCSEAYEHLFGEPLKGAHDALTDVTACMRIYFKLKEFKSNEKVRRCINMNSNPLNVDFSLKT